VHDDLHKEDADRSGGSGISYLASRISQLTLELAGFEVGDKLPTVRIPPKQGLQRPS